MGDMIAMLKQPLFRYFWSCKARSPTVQSPMCKMIHCSRRGWRLTITHTRNIVEGCFNIELISETIPLWLRLLLPHILHLRGARLERERARRMTWLTRWHLLSILEGRQWSKLPIQRIFFLPGTQQCLIALTCGWVHKWTRVEYGARSRQPFAHQSNAFKCT